MKTSRRIKRATSMAQREFRHYCSAYRRDAREQGVAPTVADRYTWLKSVSHRIVPGAGLLSWSGDSNPMDAHDAALRVLAQFAPGLRMDTLELRAELRKAYAAAGMPAPYIRLHHA